MVGPEAAGGRPLGKLRDGDHIRIVIDRNRLEGAVDFVGDGGGDTLRRKAPGGLPCAQPRRPRADPLLPEETRLWAELQRAGGGVWGGCVFDVDAISKLIRGRKKRRWKTDDRKCHDFARSRPRRSVFLLVRGRSCLPSATPQSPPTSRPAITPTPNRRHAGRPLRDLSRRPLLPLCDRRRRRRQRLPSLHLAGPGPLARGPVVFRPGEPHVWAPDVWRDPASGRFFLYYTANSAIGVAEAAGPLDPFTNPRKLFDSSIDAHLFCDGGRLYLYFVQLPGFRITVQEMASLTEERRAASRPPAGVRLGNPQRPGDRGAVDDQAAAAVTTCSTAARGPTRPTTPSATQRPTIRSGRSPGRTTIRFCTAPKGSLARATAARSRTAPALGGSSTTRRPRTAAHGIVSSRSIGCTSTKAAN